MSTGIAEATAVTILGACGLDATAAGTCDPLFGAGAAVALALCAAPVCALLS